MAAQRWLDMAKANEEASALLAENGNWRSSVSRSYYAAYSAVHSMLIHRGETPPTRGNWAHDDLGGLLHTNLSTRNPKEVRPASKQFRLNFNDLVALRVAADYGPMLEVGGNEAKSARQLAGPFVRLAERILST